MSLIGKIFPENPNEYRGNNLAFYALILYSGLLIWRSFVHFLFWEFGLHDIANVMPLEGTPDPMNLIYLFFSVWGLEQVIRSGLTVMVLIKYRGFIPLMFLINIIEWGVRAIYPLTDFFPSLTSDYTNGITPGAEGVPYILTFLVISFILSLKNKHETRNYNE